MTKMRLVLTDPAEAAVVNEIAVRPLRPEAEAEWDHLRIRHHYLRSATMVGEQLRYVAEYRGQWMALLGWSAAAYHLKGRDGWILAGTPINGRPGCIWWPATPGSAGWGRRASTRTWRAGPWR